MAYAGQYQLIDSAKTLSGLLNPLPGKIHTLKKSLPRIIKPFILSVLIVLGGSLSQSAFARDRDWQPRRTFVFVVGLLKWQNKDVFNSFPQTNRRDAQLVEYFRQQGVPEDQIVFLKDAQATTRRVNKGFTEFLSKTQPGDFLFFYYTGHGYQSEDERTTYFATYDAGADVEGWATDAIVRDVEKYFRGSQALLAADTCFSGSLTAQAQRLGRRVSYATLTSSSATQQSTENWTFTEMLLDGFRGKSFADINGNGEITLAELAQDIRDDMAFAENQRSTFVTTGSFPANMLIASAARRIDPMISRRVEVRSDGDWFKAKVIDARRGTYQVHFYGYEEADNEWVTLRQIRSSRQNEYALNQRASSDWSTSPNSPRTSPNRRNDGWQSGEPQRRPRPSSSNDPSWESRPVRNAPSARNTQGSWNN